MSILQPNTNFVFVHAKQSPPDRPFDMSQSVLLLLEDASRMFERIDICVLCDVKAKAAWQKFSEDHRRNRRADNVFILTPGDISREEFITAQQRDGEYFGESATKRFIFIDRLIWSRYSVRLDFLHRFLAVQRHYGFYTVLVKVGILVTVQEVILHEILCCQDLYLHSSMLLCLRI